MFNFNNLLRENIKKVKPYASARDEYKGTEGIFLDANENALGSVTSQPYNRYPDPQQKLLKNKIAALKNVNQKQIFIGNGSDEAIDLLFRAICVPGKDNVIIMPPTYGMYEVSASINDVAIKEAPLIKDFQMDIEAIMKTVDKNTKMIFVCSPNNPTGNSLDRDGIEKILKGFNGVVVVDEAYIDFAPEKSMLKHLSTYPNMVVMQTFSKAWGLAALRLGMAFASEEIIGIINKIKPPYNISGAAQQLALEGLEHLDLKEKMIGDLLKERKRLAAALQNIKSVLKVYPSDANFLLVKFTSGSEVYNYLIEKKIITRDRSKVAHCENSLRITVGTQPENDQLIKVLESF